MLLMGCVGYAMSDGMVDDGMTEAGVIWEGKPPAGHLLLSGH